ncbi:MAG: hypothetical protein ACK559_31130, partial [bacterium]
MQPPAAIRPARSCDEHDDGKRALDDPRPEPRPRARRRGDPHQPGAHAQARRRFAGGIRAVQARLPRGAGRRDRDGDAGQAAVP